MAAVLATGSIASAKPQARSAKAKKHAKPAVRAPLSSEEPIATPDKPVAISANALLVQYQRVGRELMLLANERSAQIGVEKADAKLSCTELQATFRSIKIADAVKTSESRAEVAALLDDLHGKVERLRGVALTKACLDNPLAKECS